MIMSDMKITHDVFVHFVANRKRVRWDPHAGTLALESLTGTLGGTRRTPLPIENDEYRNAWTLDQATQYARILLDQEN